MALKIALLVLAQHVPIVQVAPWGQMLLGEHWQTAFVLVGQTGSIDRRQHPPEKCSLVFSSHSSIQSSYLAGCIHSQADIRPLDCIVETRVLHWDTAEEAPDSSLVLRRCSQ